MIQMMMTGHAMASSTTTSRAHTANQQPFTNGAAADQTSFAETLADAGHTAQTTDQKVSSPDDGTKISDTPKKSQNKTSDKAKDLSVPAAAGAAAQPAAGQAVAPQTQTGNQHVPTAGAADKSGDSESRSGLARTYSASARGDADGAHRQPSPGPDAVTGLHTRRRPMSPLRSDANNSAASTTPTRADDATHAPQAASVWPSSKTPLNIPLLSPHQDQPLPPTASANGSPGHPTTNVPAQNVGPGLPGRRGVQRYPVSGQARTYYASALDKKSNHLAAKDASTSHDNKKATSSKTSSSNSASLASSQPSNHTANPVPTATNHNTSQPNSAPATTNFNTSVAGQAASAYANAPGGGFSGANQHTAGSGVFSQASSTMHTSPDAALNEARLVRGLHNAVQQRGGAVTLRLTPPSLGLVRISLQLHGGTVSAQLHAETSPARQMLSQQINQLRQALRDQGLTVDKLTVQPLQPSGSGNASQSQAQSQMGQQHQQQAEQSPRDGRSRGFMGQSFAGSGQGGSSQSDQRQRGN